MIDWAALYESAVAAQIPETTFLSLTPWALTVHLDAWRKREQREFDKLRWHAWHVAALGRMKTFPKASEFLAPVDDTGHNGRGLTENELKRRFMVLAERSGVRTHEFHREPSR